MPAVLDFARGYIAAGLSVIPVRTNGSKAPAESGWRTYSDRRPNADELHHWFGNGHSYGIGIPGGPASGNLAVLDFETWAIYETWLKSLSRSAEKATRKCPLARTGGGGAHLYARLEDPVDGVVLARHLVDGSPETLIEIRGNGQQVVAPGSPACCHESGQPYEWMRPSWTEGGQWSPTPWEEWFEWIDKAATLNTYTAPPTVAPPDTRSRIPRLGTSPGDDFNHRGTWEETGLFEAGWQWNRRLDNDRGTITRPGKDEGTSATLGMVTAKDGDHPLFYPFTTNCHPFESGKSYSRFRVFAILKSRTGDAEGRFSSAARELAGRGYGDQSRAAKVGGLNYSSNPEASPPQPAAATPAEPKPALPLVYYSDIGPALDAADYVEGLLIDGAMSVIYGESGCGKTFFTLDLSLHVAAGMPWRGREVDRRGVLYLALEGSHGIKNRVAAFKLARGANAVDLPFAIVPVALNLLSEDGDTGRVVEAAKEAAERLTIPVGLIVVDTLSRAMAGGNENASEDMGALVRHLDVIRQALPSHVAVVHHSGKDAARGARGHSLLRAATDTEIEVSRDPGSKRSTARVTKQRELEIGAEFGFELIPVDLGTNRRGKVVRSCVVRHDDAATVGTVDRRLQREMERDRLKRKLEQAKDEEAESAVLRAIDEQQKAGRPGASRSAIRRAVGWRPERADEVIDRLVETGAIVRTGPYKITTGQGATVEVKDGFKRSLALTEE